MRNHTDPEDRPSTRTLTALTAAFVIAAGCHGVLAVVFKAWWHGVLAVMLLVAASGLLTSTVRSVRAGRAAWVPVIPPSRQMEASCDWDGALEHLVSMPEPEEVDTPRDTLDGTAM